MFFCGTLEGLGVLCIGLSLFKRLFPPQSLPLTS